MTPGPVVFVTTELAPSTPGGAGVLIAELGRRLVAAGTPVTVLLVADAETPDTAPFGVVAAPPPPGSSFLERSRAAGEALRVLASTSSPARIEFQDFDGLGFWALSHRAELGLSAVPVTVRLHGPLDLLAEAMDRAPEDWDVPALMERQAFAMADAVLVPSTAIAELAGERYGLDPDRLVVAEPPIDRLPPVQRAPHGVEFAVLGRLGEMKGSQDFVEAAILLLDSGVEGRFRLIGADGWSVAAARPMSEQLAAMIPPRYRDHIVHEPDVARAGLAGALASVTAVVVPSRFESFCLAAHEARGAGLPLVLADLPAFRPYFGEQTGALVYDGSVEGLARAMGRLAGDPALVRRLAESPPPRYRDPLEPYATLPPVRPERAQAGLATAAVQRLEAVQAAAVRVPLRTRLAAGLLRIVPEPVAGAAVRVLPGSLKDRFRRHASWPAEAARRQAEERRRRFRERVAAGAFPETEEPRVSVVIPCFDQGRYLEDALISVFEQDFDAFEVIVVDDGSTDPNTVTALDALDLPRVRLHRQENLGLSGARNAGMGLARGRYLVPLDADDELAPGFLRELVAALEHEPGAGFAHCWADLFGDQDALWVTRPFNPYQMLLSNSVVGCVVLRREAWEAVGRYDETMRTGNEDWEMWLRLGAAGWGQVQVPRPLFRYRKHGVSMSVETEARFEAARLDMAARHPALYEEAAVRERKRAWYPLVSVITEPGANSDDLLGQDLDDLEVISIPAPPDPLSASRERGWELRTAAGFDEAVRSARGKYVAEWSRITDASPDLLRRAAEALEGTPEAAAAGTADLAGPVLWRRWTLLDPTAPHRDTVVAGGSVGRVGPARLGPGSHPDPHWTPPSGTGRTVLRQPPEEEGRIPAWLRDRWREEGR